MDVADTTTWRSYRRHHAETLNAHSGTGPPVWVPPPPLPLLLPRFPYRAGQSLETYGGNSRNS